jgi:TatA/E family protein of Tat protein translocase
MGSLGTMEMVVILVIALVVFGPRKLPDLGRSLGRSLNEFKKASNELRNTLEDEVRLEERKEQRAKVEAEQQTAVAAAEVPASPAVDDPLPSPEAEVPPVEAPTVSRSTPA